MSFVFDYSESLKINDARLSHLASLGLALNNKTVLEVGSGIGLLTYFFEDRNCSVVSIDARLENVNENLRRHPNRKVSLADLNIKNSLDVFGKFDVVFCYGVLYHTPDPAQVIADMASVCNGMLLIETCVWSCDNGLANTVKEGPYLDQSICGVGCRPARDWLFSELCKYFPFVYVSAGQPDHVEFPKTWPSSGRARAVFVSSRYELSIPTLIPFLPNTQG